MLGLCFAVPMQPMGPVRPTPFSRHLSPPWRRSRIVPASPDPWMLLCCQGWRVLGLTALADELVDGVSAALLRSWRPTAVCRSAPAVVRCDDGSQVHSPHGGSGTADGTSSCVCRVCAVCVDWQSASGMCVEDGGGW